MKGILKDTEVEFGKLVFQLVFVKHTHYVDEFCTSP